MDAAEGAGQDAEEDEDVDEEKDEDEVVAEDSADRATTTRRTLQRTQQMTSNRGTTRDLRGGDAVDNEISGSSSPGPTIQNALLLSGGDGLERGRPRLVFGAGRGR